MTIRFALGSSSPLVGETMYVLERRSLECDDFCPYSIVAQRPVGTDNILNWESTGTYDLGATDETIDLYLRFGVDNRSNESSQTTISVATPPPDAGQNTTTSYDGTVTVNGEAIPIVVQVEFEYLALY